MAYEILANDKNIVLPTKRQLQILHLLTHASGAIGMAGGQAVDLASVGKKLTLPQLENMHRDLNACDQVTLIL